MGRDPKSDGQSHRGLDFNPLSPHGERPRRRAQKEAVADISLHSPRMGRDPPADKCHKRSNHISIHSPRMGRDRRETHFSRGRMYFNPLSPHGERRAALRLNYSGKYFNPLSPHGERHRHFRPGGGISGFQSTLPAWGETAEDDGHLGVVTISIHSPRMGRD